MENFLKPFLGKSLMYLLNNESFNVEGNSETNVIKFVQKIIFKHDVLVELKEVLNSVCSPEPFIVRNDIVKEIIKRLNILAQSNDDVNQKINIFCYTFRSFASSCNGDENVTVMQFFVVLSHILGMNAFSNINHSNETDCNYIINAENFKSTFNVDITPPSQECFSIFKELLVCLSKTNINLCASEIQPYNKWLQQLFKSLPNFHPFQNVFMEIFLISADIDLKFLEENLDNIFCNIFSQKLPNQNFCDLYSFFLERSLIICAKFQRTVKFVSKFLSSIKTTSVYLVREIILPSNVITEFSKIVATASNQLSLSLLDILVLNVNESFILISQNCNGSLLLFVVSDLLITFLKEVKLYAPSIASTTLQAFINKLIIFKENLQKFGEFLFKEKSFILKNENIVETFLELCFYCGEIQTLINCYKDSILQPSDMVGSTPDFDWQCCLSSEQWEKLVNLVLKSKLKTCALKCFQLALQKLRTCKLEKRNFTNEDSVSKIIVHHLMSDFNEFNIFKEVHPEDLIILINALTVTQFKSISKNILRQMLQNDNKAEWITWLSNSAIQENPVFIVTLFSEILKEMGFLLQDIITDKNYSKISWLLDEYFDDDNCIYDEIAEQLPNKINALLKSSKKIRKFFSKNLEKKESLIRIIEIFKLLPLPYMKNNYRKLGLSFAVGIGTILADDESAACLVFEAICYFLNSDTDASTCCDVGLCIKCFVEFSYQNKSAEDLKVKVIEYLVRNSPHTKFGLNQIGEMINSIEIFKCTTPLKILETQVVLYNELGKCWQRAKKRKSDNDLIGSYRIKIAKMISDETKKLQENNINPQNCKLFLKIFAIELNKAIKMNDENEIANLIEQKFPSYFNFSVKNLKKDFDEASATFLTVVLQSMPELRKFLPQNLFLKIWKALKIHEKVSWRLFCNHSNEEEFSEILSDLLKMSKKFLNSESERHSLNCFEIWVSFFQSSSDTKKNLCQLRLQEFFNYIHDCDLFLKDLSIRKKIFLIKFFFFCISDKKVIVTSLVLDTIIHVMLECLDDSASIEDFQSLFSAEAEVASGILLEHFAWSKSKVHLTFIIFKRMLGVLITRCDSNQQINNDDIIKLSTCAFCLEKWVSLIEKREKDFARISAYFIITLISSITSITVFPAIKIHLINCINHFLSISDPHTVSYLMRVLKPGHQQVFNTLYDQFKKYHKYSGKI